MRPIRLTERVIRYGLCGVLVTATYAGLVVGLSHCLPRLGPPGNAALAFIFMQPIGLLLHSTITYPETIHARRHLPRIGLRFAVTNTIGFAISVSGMALVTLRLHDSYLWGITLACVVLPTVNFVVYFFWAFRPAHNHHNSIPL